MDNNIKKRYDWLDIIKAICIITVVLFHIEYQSSISIFNTTWDYLDKISGLYKVTIFYCVAGITLNNDKIKNTFKFLFHKFKKVYLKAVVIGIIAVLLHNLLISLNFYELGRSYSGKIMIIYGVKDYIKNIIYTLLLGNREVILGAFWFVYSLIICFIILALLEFVINKIKFINNKRETRLFITFMLMFISIFVSNYYNITIPRFSNSLVGLFLLDFTNYLYENKKFEKTNYYLIISSIICILSAPFFGTIAMNKNIIPSPYFLIVVVLSSLYFLIFISKKIENIRIFNFLKYIGKNSFSIMAFHFIGFKLGGILLNIIGISNNISLLVPKASNIIFLMYYLTFGITFSLIISFLLKRIFKFEL